MDIKEALAAFDSLSQDTRLRVFRLLVEYGELGAPAGTLSESLHIPHNTLSFHLSHMSHAGLVLSSREGRSVIYSANFEFFSGLIRYMVKDCCRGDDLQCVESSEKAVLCIDEDSGSVVEGDTNPDATKFFEQDGVPSAALKAMLDFLTRAEQNRTATDLALAALAEAGVFNPGNYL